MSVMPGQTITLRYGTYNSDGANEDATSGPTGLVYIDGTVDDAVVTVTDVGTGDYKAAFVVAAEATAGQTIQLQITATVDSRAIVAYVWTDTVDTVRESDTYARIGEAGAGLTALGDARLANLDAAISDVGDAVSSLGGDLDDLDGRLASVQMGVALGQGAGSVAVASYDVVQGSVVGGNLASVKRLDGNKLQIQGYTAEVAFYFTVPGGCTPVAVVVNATASVMGGVSVHAAYGDGKYSKVIGPDIETNEDYQVETLPLGGRHSVPDVTDVTVTISRSYYFPITISVDFVALVFAPDHVALPENPIVPYVQGMVNNYSPVGSRVTFDTGGAEQMPEADDAFAGWCLMVCQGVQTRSVWPITASERVEPFTVLLTLSEVIQNEWEVVGRRALLVREADVAAALAAYDGPTKAELDAAVAPLALEATAQAVVADIGEAGAGLTALPWNAAWDAEVQSECADALTAYGASTYDGSDTAGTTTLLSRLSAARAGYLDYLAGWTTTIYAQIADLIWTYIYRTLTQGAASVTTAVTGTSVTTYRGTTWSVPLTGLADFTGWTKLLVALKDHESDADSASVAMWQVSNPGAGTDGLLYINGAAATAANGSITVNSTTSITITLAASVADDVPIRLDRVYGIKAFDAAGVDLVSIGGTWDVLADIPKAVS